MMLSLILAAAACGEVAVERAELKSAMVTMKRLAAAASVAAPGDIPATTRRRTVIGHYITFLDKFHAQLVTGRVTASEMFNLLQDVRDMVTAGSELVPLPEEKLCWERAGLNLAVAHRHIVKGQVELGVIPPQSLDQAIAQVARFKQRYRDALARCVAAADAGK